MPSIATRILNVIHFVASRAGHYSAPFWVATSSMLVILASYLYIAVASVFISIQAISHIVFILDLSDVSSATSVQSERIAKVLKNNSEKSDAISELMDYHASKVGVTADEAIGIFSLWIDHNENFYRWLDTDDVLLIAAISSLAYLYIRTLVNSSPPSFSNVGCNLQNMICEIEHFLALRDINRKVKISRDRTWVGAGAIYLSISSLNMFISGDREKFLFTIRHENFHFLTGDFLLNRVVSFISAASSITASAAISIVVSVIFSDVLTGIIAFILFYITLRFPYKWHRRLVEHCADLHASRGTFLGQDFQFADNRSGLHPKPKERADFVRKTTSPYALRIGSAVILLMLAFQTALMFFAPPAFIINSDTLSPKDVFDVSIALVIVCSSIMAFFVAESRNVVRRCLAVSPIVFLFAIFISFGISTGLMSAWGEKKLAFFLLEIFGGYTLLSGLCSYVLVSEAGSWKK